MWGRVAVVVVVVGVALCGVLASAAQARSVPRHYQLGVYVTSLHDLDTARRTAGIDMWLWSVSSGKRRPLQTIELVNADDYTLSLASTVARPQGAWSQVKVSGTFRQLWDFSKYPFDHQLVSVGIEEGVQDTSSFLYRVDRLNSSYDHGIQIPGWQITSFDVRPLTERYDTTFGDPLLAPGGHSYYSRVVVELHLRRAGAALTFFNLTVALYAAILIALVTFFLHPDTMSDLGARMALIAAALFAAVLNMIQTSSAIGAPTGFDLLVELHVVAFVLIVVATTIAIMSRRRLERGVDPMRIRRFDHRSFAVCATLVVVANVALVAAAV